MREAQEKQAVSSCEEIRLLMARHVDHELDSSDANRVANHVSV